MGRLDPEDVWLVNKITLVEKTGWTLEYIETLDVQEFNAIVAVFEGLDKARAHLQRPSQGSTAQGGVRKTRVI